MIYVDNVHPSLRKSYSSIDEDDQETGMLNEFSKGVGAGVDQLQGLIGGGGKALAGSLFGNDEWFVEGMSYYEEQMNEAAQNQADVGRFEDIEGFGDMLNYSAFIVGNVVPSLIGGGGAGLVGGAIAKGGLKKIANTALSTIIKPNAQKLAKQQSAKAFSATQAGREIAGKQAGIGRAVGAMAFGTAAGAGESFTRILEETGEEAPLVALATGIASGSLDALTPMRVLKRVVPAERYKDIAEKVGESVASNSSMKIRMLKEAGKTAGIEGATEMMQEIVQNSTLEVVRGLGADLEGSWVERMTTEDKMSQYMNAAIAGAIGGAAIGGVSGIAKNPTKIEREPETEAPTVSDSPTVSDVPAPATLEENPAQGRIDAQQNVADQVANRQGRGNTAPMTIEEARAKAQDLPSARETSSDPAARRQEAQRVIRDQIAGMTGIRRQVKEIYRQEELGALGETTRIPAEKPAPIATPEEVPFGGNLPENITPPLDALVGTDVDYAGNKGLLGKNDQGYFVATQDNGDVFIESGEYQTLADLGVTPLSGDLEFQNDLVVDPETKKFQLRGEEFTLTRIIKDAQGQALSLAVRDSRGKRKTIRTKEIVKRIESQLATAPDFSQIKVELDELPVDIQQAIVEQSDPESIPDEVTAQEALDVASTLPNADQLTTALNESFQINLPKGDVDTSTPMQYNQTIRRPSLLTPLSEAVKDINQSQGSNRSAIDEARIDSLFDGSYDGPIPLEDGGELMPINMLDGIESPEGMSAQIRDEVKVALLDLIEAGMPKSVLKDISGIYIHSQGAFARETDGAFFPSTGALSLSRLNLVNLVMESDNNNNRAGGFRYVLAHELGHAYDISRSLSETAPEFEIVMDGITSEGVELQVGSILNELGRNYQNSTELGLEMSYPFGDAWFMLNDNPTDVDDIIGVLQKEAFAQAFAVFHSSPELLQQSAPLTYNYFKKLLQTPTEIQNDGKANTQAQETDSQVAGVRADVRPQTVSGSEQVQDGSGAGEDGRGSAVAEEASEGLGEQGQPQDGDDSGQSVQLERTEVVLKATDKKPTFKKAENYEDTGNYIVTFADGDRYTIYFDDDAKESGEEVFYTSEDGKIPQSDAMLGETRAETITLLQEYRQRLIDAGEQSYNLPLDPQVSSDTSFKAYMSITDHPEGKLKLTDLRKKFPKLEDNQFDQMIQGLTGPDSAPEDLMVVQDGVISHPETVQEIEEERLAEERMIAEESDFESDLDLLADDDMLFAPVSTRFPTGKGDEDPIQQLLVNDYQSYVDSPIFAKNMVKVKEYSNLTKKEQSLPDDQASEALIEHAKENLLSIYDAVPEGTRAIAKQWYKGANKIVQRIADKHDITLAQASAVAANLSPQKDWYQNASLAERVIDIYNENIAAPFDNEMKARAEEIYFHKGVGLKSIAANREKLDIIQGKSLQELIDEGASTSILGMWIRTYDQTYNSPSYRLVSPDGKFLDYATNSDGKTQSKAAWGSLGEIGKAVSVLVDGSQENISRSLGSKNKVRNFYNNIFTPNATEGYVTIDTHAVAAALMKPLSGNSLEVSHNFGGLGISNSSVTGHNGTYSIYEEAYRRAAADRGVLAREMQSITWEAVRGLFTATYKAQKQNVLFVQGVWNQYNDGKLSLDEARAKINEHSGGIQRPDWERPDYSVPDEVSKTSYQRKLSDRGVPRPDTRPQEATGSGTGGDAARVSATQVTPEQDILLAPPSRAFNPNETLRWTSQDLLEKGDLRGAMNSLSLHSDNKAVRTIASKLAEVTNNRQNLPAAREATKRSKVKSIVYHGSPQTNITEFKAGDVSQGLYFSPDRNLSEMYMSGLIGSGSSPSSSGKGRVYEVMLDIRNPLVLQSEDQLTFIEKIPVALGRKTKKEVVRAKNAKQLLGADVINSMTLTKSEIASLKAQGYDGIMNDYQSEYVVFDSSQIHIIDSGKGGTQVQVVDGLKTAGSFNPKTNTIQLDSSRGMNEHTLLHEMTHAATSATLFDQSHPLTKELTKLFGEVKPFLGNEYGITNLDEFVAEGMSNEQFRDKLDTITLKDTEGSALQRFFDSVISFLRNLVDIQANESAQTEFDSLVAAILAPAPMSRDATTQALPRKDDASSSNTLFSPTRSASDILTNDELIDSVRASTGGRDAINSAKNKSIKGIYKGAQKGLAGWAQKNLSSRGLLPQTAFDSMIERDGQFGAVEIDIRQLVGHYDLAIEEAYGDDISKAVGLDEALNTPVLELPSLGLAKNVQDAVAAMRAYIDGLSVDYAEILNQDIERLRSEGNDEATAKSEILGIVVNNMGRYANRSFRAFDDPNWNEAVPEQVILDAREYLASNGTVNPDQVINTILKEGTAFDDMGSFIAESKLGAKDLSILKKRQDIAPEIRALLGEYKDPRINFARSATKMSRLIYNDKFLKQVLVNGLDTFLFNQEDAPVNATKRIAEIGSKSMNPLNGYYTFPEVEQAFRDALDAQKLNGLYKTIVQINGAVKYGKTIIAPTTVARNWMSASMFTIANGHFNWSKIGKSLEATNSYRTGMGDQVAYLKRIKQLGVVYDNPYAGEMIKLLEDSNIDNLINPDGKIKGFFDGATRFYQYGDDFWKIVGFENEVQNFMELKGDSREAAEVKAAERIRDTYPTYSLIGALPRKLRQFPLLGTFVSFPAEIIRTQANMLKYLRQDLADPDMRPAALKRMAGMAMMSAGVYAAQAMAMSAFDVSEEEEEAIKLMAAPWAKNSNILVTGRDEKGRLEYLDLTHLDPYALYKRPLNAIMRDQPAGEAILDASWEIMKPFLGWDISTATILQHINNEKASGSQIYNPADTFTNKVVDVYEHYEKGMGPSILQNARRMEKALSGEVSGSGKAYDVGDEMGALIGFRKTTFDPKTALHFKAYEFNEAKRNSTSLLTSSFRDPNGVSDGNLRDAFQRASDARKQAFKDMSKLVSASVSSGISPTQAMVILRSNGVTQKDAKALITGGESAWTMSDSTLKNSISKSDLLFGKGTSQVFSKRWAMIQKWLAEES